MTSWYPGLAGIDDKGFGGSRAGDPINGVVEHHTTSTPPQSSLGYVANQNSRNSHPNYLIQNSGAAFGIVHPDRRPYSTAGRPDTEAIAFEIDNESGGPNWNISDAAAETLAQIIAYHYIHSPRYGHGIARNIPGVVQAEFFVAWHSQYVATMCPGPNVRDQRQSAIIARALQIAHPTPPPIDGNVTVTPGARVGVKSPFSVFSSAAAARAGSPVKATYPAGNYYVFKTDKADCVNLGKSAGKAGGWATIASVGLTAPAPTLYNVVFDDTPDDPTSDYSKVQVSHGDRVSAPATVPVRSGFTFLGWFDLNGSVTAPYDFTKPVTGLLTLVAHWEAGPVSPVPDQSDLDEISDNAATALGGSETENGDAVFAGLLAGHPAARKRTYYAYAAAALVISFGPDIVTAGVLTNSAVPVFVAYVSLASSILLKLGTALGFIAASNTAAK